MKAQAGAWGTSADPTSAVTAETLVRTAHARTNQETLYTITVRGNTVMDMSPRDPDPMHQPQYQREHMRAEKAPMREVTRFVPDRIITGW